MKICLVIAFALIPMAAWGQVAAIQPVQPADEPDFAPTIVRLSLSPAPEPIPALKYELLPGPAERQPGNAVPYYYRALLALEGNQEDLNKLYAENYEAWTSGPLDKLDKELARKWVNSRQGALHSLQTAVYREYCDWDWRIGDLQGMEAISFRLEEVQQARELGRVLHVKARLEMAEGKLDAALETIRQGYQLAHDVGQPPLLISELVGVALCSQMNGALVELIDQPGAPNLYWALASLPKPLIDFRPGLRMEMQLPEKLLPFLKDAETAERSPEQWQRLLNENIKQLQALGDGPSSSKPWLDGLAMAAMVARNYPTAKAELIKSGMDSEKVEKMPVGQVLAIQSSRVIRYSYHEIFKCMLLDYPESSRHLAETNDRLVREGYLRPGLSQKDPLGLTGLLLPAVSSVNQASIRLARNLAAAQTLEAIRMHMAASGGTLPRSLAEITVVPVPSNPATGDPFGYERQGDEATLVVPAVLAAQQEGPVAGGLRDAIHYVITVEAAR